MQNIYETTNGLDKRAIEHFGLSEEILVENAANGMLELIRSKVHDRSVITIVCGSGDNGADGYALARKLSGTYRVNIYEAKTPKSTLCQRQAELAKNIDEIKFVQKIMPSDVIVDCIFGSGFKGMMEEAMQKLIAQMNAIKAIKIACDIPSGLSGGQKTNILQAHIFRADFSVCMGALKSVLFSDVGKDFVGRILVAELGISRKNFELPTNMFLLESKDLLLPRRVSQNQHKGDFGHLVLICGDKEGASILGALSALHFGAGLVSIIDKSHKAHIPYEILSALEFPQNTSAIALGMGLGAYVQESLDMLEQTPLNLPCVLDADALYHTKLLEILESTRPVVLTPHPKEFRALQKICSLTSSDNKIKDVLSFSAKFPHAVLLLKGANSLIAHQDKLYINTLGNVALAKGGSGDVLAGMIGALLAQGFSPLDSAIYASLAHAIAAKTRNNYALTSSQLIHNISKL